MSALGDKGITLEGLAAAEDTLRQELATWKALAHKQDQLTADQITATQSGATAAKISQIAVNTAAIQSLAAQVAGQISLAYVTTLPATGEPLTLYLVPQGDGTAPNFCNEYLWINNAWELIGTTGAMANNGELTIQVNGVAVGTFTANQAANSAINIAVPTNTNQLVNGAGYVDAAALQAALALKQNSLNASQLEAVNSGITAAAVQQITDNAIAIAGKQDALTAAQQAAVDSGATAAKIDQIASNASAIVSLTSSKQDALSTTQLAAVNSGITAAAVQQITDNAIAIAGKQDALTTAQQAAVDSGATTAKIDQIASNASAIVSLTSSKQDTLSTTQLAAVNSGVTSAAVQQISTNTDAIATKAADNAVVHLAGAETITGNKTFTGAVLNDGFYEKTQETAIDVRTNPSANQSSDVIKIWSGAQSTRGDYLGGMSFAQFGDGSLRLQLTCFGYPTSGNTYQNRISFRSFRNGESCFYPETSIRLGRAENRWNGVYDANSIFVYNAYTFGTAPSATCSWGLRNRDNAGVEVVDFLAYAYSSGTNSAVLRCLNTDGTNTYDRRLELVVAANGTTQLKPCHNAQYGLGSGSYKWATLNGINPGALGMPNNSAYIDISSSISDRTYGANSFVAAATGWIAIGSFATAIQISDDTTGIATTGLPGTDGYASVFLPVRANDRIRVLINQTSTTYQSFRLLPCLGNV